MPRGNKKVVDKMLKIMEHLVVEMPHFFFSGVGGDHNRAKRRVNTGPEFLR